MSRKAVAEKFLDEVYDITVCGRHVQVTEGMEKYAIDKISKIEKHFTRVIDVVVEMDIQKLLHRVDISMKVDSIVIRSSATTDNMYASIDRAVDKLKAQLRRYKQRIQDHQVKGNNSVDIKVQVVAPEIELDIVNDEILSENASQLIEKYAPHEIVSEESRPLKTLNRKEALMKIELSGDPFLVFRSEEDQKLKVIYRRKDRNFGIIEPE
ncbi:MAG: ribosome-associated translation inhibitor RaiA [Parachlamydiaceae bacterium]|nr:ribosome-associated translation inhibitor RaiA [Parachlamydiaceae bacterium]